MAASQPAKRSNVCLITGSALSAMSRPLPSVAAHPLQDPHPSDSALVAAATRLEEAWAWGLDPDMWRAHLGPLTWPGEGAGSGMCAACTHAAAHCYTGSQQGGGGYTADACTGQGLRSCVLACVAQ